MADREFRARLYAEVGRYIDDMNKAKRATIDVADATSDTGRRATEMANKLDATGQKMQTAGRRMSLGLTVPLVAGAGVAVNAASDLEESMSKVNVIFGEQSEAMYDWADDAATTFGMSRREALDSAGSLGAMFDAMDYGAPVAADMSQTMVELAGDLASFNNESPEDMLTALRSGLVGEVEPLRRFGVLLNAATVEQRAMEMGLADATGEVSESAKVQARYALILENTTTAQGDYVRTSDGMANTQRTVRAQFEDTAAVLGQQLLPIAIDLMEVVQDVVVWFGELDDGQQEFIIKAGLAAAAAGPLLSVLGGIARGVSGIITLSQTLGALNVGSTIGTIGRTALRTLGPYAAALGVLEYASNRWFEHHDDVDATVTGLTQMLEDGITDIAHLTDTFGTDLSGLGDVLDTAMALDNSALAQTFVGLSEGVRRVTFGLVDIDTTAEIARDEIGELGTAIAAMVSAGDMADAAGTLDMLVDAADDAGVTFGDLIGLIPDADQAFRDQGVSVERLVALMDSGVAPAEALEGAMTDAAGGSDDLADGLTDVGAAGDDAAAGVDAATEAVNGYVEAQRRATDPVYGFIGALRDYEQAQADAAAVQEDLAAGEASAQDLEDAYLALSEAGFLVRDSAIEMDQAGGDAIGALRDLQRDGLLTEDQLREVADAFETAQQRGEDFARPYEARAEIDVDMSDLDEFERRLAALDGRLSEANRFRDVSPGGTPVRAPAPVGGGGVMRASGGPVQAGMPYIVGERRPEVFVPRISGRIIPSVDGFRANAGRAGDETKTFSVTVQQWSENPMRDASVELRKLALAAGR